MRRTFCIWLSLLFLFPSYVFAETIDVTESDVSIEETEEKIYCNATIEDDFEEGVVLVTLKKSATTSASASKPSKKQSNSTSA